MPFLATANPQTKNELEIVAFVGAGKEVMDRDLSQVVYGEIPNIAHCGEPSVCLSTGAEKNEAENREEK